jgi:alkylhydroperoxidase/carboxymuconolactone decarboxylase family protein YurZ
MITDREQGRMAEKQGLPAAAGQVAESYPELWRAYAALGAACAGAGPLAPDAQRLVKLALAIGAGSEGGVHSHSRRALAEGAAPEALKQVALLAIPTLGFPRAVAALTWIEDVTDPGKRCR